jgi:cobalt-precorrin 5A hydrolase
LSTALITLSSEGFQTAERIRRNGIQGADLFITEGVLESIYSDENKITMFQGGVGNLTTTIFTRYENLIYIMPLGIVMRTIARHLSSKHTDPAVVVVDISGRWVISALSGHEGGANKLAELTARALNTDFIVTTSTEARKNLVLGVGCRKNIANEDVERAVNMALHKLGRKKDEIRLIATIERKKDEEGLLCYCSENDIPLRSISAEEIRESRIVFRESGFVRRVLGVGAVAVPCALLGGHKTKLILDRIVCSKVTVAAALENLDW